MGKDEVLLNSYESVELAGLTAPFEAAVQRNIVILYFLASIEGKYSFYGIINLTEGENMQDLRKLTLIFMFVGIFACAGSFSMVLAGQDSAGIINKAETLVKSGDYEQAKVQLQKAIKAHPDDESLWKAYNSVSGRGYVAGWAADDMRWAPMKPKKFVADVVLKKKIALVDVRSPLETSVWYPKSKLFDTFLIPLPMVPSSLYKIHPEKYDEVVFLCPTGTRAASSSLMAGMMGYKNVYFFKGGYKVLTGLTGGIYRKTEKRLLAEGKISKPTMPH